MINQTAHIENENMYVVHLAYPVAKMCKESGLQEKKKIVLGTTFLGQWQTSKRKEGH